MRLDDLVKVVCDFFDPVADGGIDVLVLLYLLFELYSEQFYLLFYELN